MKKIFVLTAIAFLALAFFVTASNSDSGKGNGNSDPGNDLNGNDDSADLNDDSNDSDGGLGQTIREQVHAGVYTDNEGNEIKVSEMAQNKLRLRVKDVDADCECNLTREVGNNKTILRIRLSNGTDEEIKIMPNTASERALERLRLKNCSAENNCTLTLKEVGKGNETRLAYEVQIERHSRILGIFSAKMPTTTEVDAENGEVLRVKKPWWAFIATQPAEN